MKLYSYWRSTAAYRVRIALNLKGVEHEISPVNLVAQEQRSRTYRTMNPQSLVPSLELPDLTLTQSVPIIEYLEELHPEPALLPDAPADRALVRAFCQAIACDIHPLNNLRVLSYLRSELNADDQAVNAWYGNWIAAGFSALESQVQSTRGDFCFGSSITMADVFLVPQMFNANRFECDVDPYPNLCEIVARLESLPAFAKAAPDLQRDAAP